MDIVTTIVAEALLCDGDCGGYVMLHNILLITNLFSIKLKNDLILLIDFCIDCDDLESKISRNVLTSFQRKDIMTKFVIALLVLVAVYAAEGKIQDQIT